MNFGNVARVLTIAAACFAAVGSATSNTNNGPAAQQQSQMNSPPPPQQMESTRALGLWRSTFGAVKIGPDDSHGWPLRPARFRASGSTSARART